MTKPRFFCSRECFDRWAAGFNQNDELCQRFRVEEVLL